MQSADSEEGQFEVCASKVVDLLNRAIDLVGSTVLAAELWSAKAKCFLAIKQYRKAEAALLEAIRLKSAGNVWAPAEYWNLSELHFLQGEIEKGRLARQEFERAFAESMGRDAAVSGIAIGTQGQN